MGVHPRLLSCLAALLAGVLVSGMAARPPAAARARAASGAGGRYRVEGAGTREQRSAVAATGAAIEAVGPGYVEVAATSEELRQIAVLGFAIRPPARPQDFPPADTAYHNYAELTAEVHAVAVTHPAIVRLFSIGRSYEGRDLWAVKISDNPQTDEDEPEALFVGHYHAREHLAVEMMLYLLHVLTDEYAPDRPADPITRLVNSREIFLIFDLNPDGGEYDTATGRYLYWRKNRQPNAGTPAFGTDPNRNHSYRWGGYGSSSVPASETYRGPAPRSAPEVATIESFVNSHAVAGVQQIVVAITFHTYGDLILWPYGYTYDELPGDMRPDDYAVFVALGRAMAETNGYTAQQSSALYLTSGDFTDWAYGVHRIFAYTFEMADDFYLPGSAIPVETARNRAAVLSLLDNAACPYAITGKADEHCADGRVIPPLRTWLPLVARVGG